MAKEVLSVRIHAKLKAWVETRARAMGTTEGYIVGQSIKHMAGSELPEDFDPQMPRKDWNNDES
jgi:hypothetical protein